MSPHLRTLPLVFHWSEGVIHLSSCQGAWKTLPILGGHRCDENGGVLPKEDEKDRSSGGPAPPPCSSSLSSAMNLRSGLAPGCPVLLG